MARPVGQQLLRAMAAKSTVAPEPRSESAGVARGRGWTGRCRDGGVRLDGWLQLACLWVS